MYKRLFTLSILLLGVIPCLQAQQTPAYDSLVHIADSLYVAEQYMEAGNHYAAAFATFGDKGYIPDRINAAKAYAMAEVPDSAFKNLFRITEKGHYTDYEELTTHPHFMPLHDQPRWEELSNLVKTKKEEKEANYDHALIAVLDSIYEEDQSYRKMIDSVEENYGLQSPEMRAHWQKIEYRDSSNLVVIKEILDTRGWLGPGVVGDTGNSTLFLVIQHADHKTQKKYLPMLRKAVKEGNAFGSQLALLEDRILMRDGKKQLYGSQLRQTPEGDMYVYPIEDPDNVDERRAEVGLPPMAEYTYIFGLTWDVEKHKQRQQEEGKQEDK